MQFTIREMQRALLKTLFPFIATSVIAGFILAILAPYGTGSVSFAWRLLGWTGMCMVGGLGASLGNWAVDCWRDDPSLVSRALYQSIGATLAVFTAYTLILARDGQGFTLNYFLTLPFYIWIISIVICGFGLLNAQRKIDTHKEDAVSRPMIFNRLKPGLQNATLYALTAEDHYVRVITDLGEDLILMRLSDAIMETHPLPGLQTHRSWWVAEAGVESVEKKDGKMVVRLRTGKDVPVSRTFAAELKAIGWV